MGTTAIMRCAIVGVGLLIMFASFWFHVQKRMNSDLAVVWFVLGVSVTVVGAIPVLSRWLNAISVWTGIAILCIAAASLLGAFRICLMISKLMTENYELAMEVSILMSERQPVEREDDQTVTEKG